MARHMTLYRRRFLGTAVSAGLCGLFGTRIRPATADTAFKPYNADTSIAIGGRGPEMIETARTLGEEYEREYHGCARCTVAALQDAIDFVPREDNVFRAASCLNGGATPTKIANCGVFSGAAMYIGWLCGADRFGDTSFAQEIIHEVYDKFDERYGSVLCRDVRAAIDQKCPEMTGEMCGEIVGILLSHFTDYEG